VRRVEQAIIFGGTGFIGTHFAQHLLREDLAGKITLVDIVPPRDGIYARTLREGLEAGRVKFCEWDVRKPVPRLLLPQGADVVINLAAIHREPGHQPKEYFETNLYGAQNVCDYADATGCSRIVFTSSIAPYGTSEELKDESTLPVPETPYGCSKLVAEAIHTAWQRGGKGRKLLIVRPGVVFGPGEGGNVTRLVRSVVKGYFVYLGNKRTRKAGGYVKELCLAMIFGMDCQERDTESRDILNFSLDPPPTMEAFVEAIKSVSGVRNPSPSAPRFLLLGASYLIDGAAKAVGIDQPVSPVRVRKMFRSTHVEAKRLREDGYRWKFTIESAFRDWMEEVPTDFM